MKIPRKHILVVESEDNSVEMLQLYLGHAKYRVTAANTCGECLQLARTERVRSLFAWRRLRRRRRL